MVPLREVDLESGPADHLGDYVEGQSPYPSSEAAWRVTTDVPDQAHADPQEVRDDAARYGAAPYRQGTQTREVPAASWAPNGHILNDGPTQPFRVAEFDPYRTRLVVRNYATDPVYVAPTPTTNVGWGACIIPAGGDVELKCTAPVWLFTVAGFIAGASPVHVQVISERYG